MKCKTIKMMVVFLLMMIFVSCISNVVFAATQEEIAQWQKDLSDLETQLKNAKDSNSKAGLAAQINAIKDKLSGAGVTTSWDVTNVNGFDVDKNDDKYTSQLITSKTQNVMGTLINTIRIIGTGVAIVMLTYIGIKYIMAAPSEKADFKKSATAYIVGAVVLFASTNILKIIADFATKNI